MSDNTCIRQTRDCSGKLVCLSDKMFTTRCSFGNLEDYLKHNQAHICNEISRQTQLFPLEILVPIYATGPKVLSMLSSLLKQNFNWDEAEIIFFINQTPHEKNDIQKINLHTKELIEYALKASNHKPTHLEEHEIQLINEIHKQKLPHKNILFKEVSSGLASVYQITVTSLIARLESILAQKNFSEKSDKIKLIDELLYSSILLIIDDDLEWLQPNDLMNAFRSAQKDDHVIMGELELTHIISPNLSLNSLLYELMKSFLIFKHDLKSSVLCPRGASLKKFFHAPNVRLDQPYADQVYFSWLNDNKTHFVKVKTHIEEKDYPSNGKLMKALRAYLETGTHESSLEIFSNLIDMYEKATHKTKYSSQDVKNLFCALKNRNKEDVFQALKKIEAPSSGPHI